MPRTRKPRPAPPPEEPGGGAPGGGAAADDEGDATRPSQLDQIRAAMAEPTASQKEIPELIAPEEPLELPAPEPEPELTSQVEAPAAAEAEPAAEPAAAATAVAEPAGSPQPEPGPRHRARGDRLLLPRDAHLQRRPEQLWVAALRHHSGPDAAGSRVREPGHRRARTGRDPHHDGPRAGLPERHRGLGQLVLCVGARDSGRRGRRPVPAG